MTSVFDVAKYIILKLGPTTHTKLQKLCYYCQAWSLVWDKRPIFKEKIYACWNGPTIKELYEAHREEFKIAKINGHSKRLSKNERETIDAVLDFYGSLTAQQLMGLLRSEYPYKDLNQDDLEMMTERDEIKLDKMQEFYSSMNEGGKE